MEKGDVVLEYSLDNRVTVKDMNSNLSSGSSKAKPRSLDEGETICYTTVKQIINRT
jgi:cell division protein YceG involved in septum cleavage